MKRIYLSPPDIRQQDYDSLNAVLDSNWVAPVGPHLTAFEQSIASLSGRKHALALNSGTAALHLALKVLGVSEGDCVICPSLTFAASANPIYYCGARPIFIDSEADTWNMDPVLLERALIDCDQRGKLPKAVVVVHLYGQCAQMDRIMQLCEYYKVPVIEDAAEALGATFKEQSAGSFGALSFFSFNGNKIITTSGGGMLLADNAAWIEKALFWATQAREAVPHYEHKEIGYNYRMSNLLAGLGSAQLGDLERRIASRKRHYEVYRKALGGYPGVAFMPISNAGRANYWLTCLTIDSRHVPTSARAIIDALDTQNIEARRIWKPLHLQPVFEGIPTYGGGVAEEIFENGLCLPSGSSMSEAERCKVIEVVNLCLSGSQA